MCFNCSGLPFPGDYDDGIAYAKIYLKSTTKSKRTILDYTFRSMVADIGGYTGLLLGVSFVHFTGLIDQVYVEKRSALFFLKKICCRFIKNYADSTGS